MLVTVSQFSPLLLFNIHYMHYNYTTNPHPTANVRSHLSVATCDPNTNRIASSKLSSADHNLVANTPPRKNVKQK